MLTEEQEQTIRQIQFMCLHLLVQNNKEKQAQLARRVEEHPEEFTDEFLKDYYNT